MTKYSFCSITYNTHSVTIGVLQSTHYNFNSSTAQLPLCTHVNNRLWIVLPYNTLCLFLNLTRGQPGSMYILSGDVLQLWQILLDVFSFWVHFTADLNGVQWLDGVREKATAGILHPADTKHWHLKIKHDILEEFFSRYPTDSQVTMSKEDGQTLPSNVVGPPLRSSI